MASTLWYHTDLELDAARATLQQAMKSLGVTRFYPPDDRFTGTDDPMEAHRRLPDWSAQVSSLGGRQGKMPKDSMVHLRLYAEPTGTTVASGIGILSASLLGIFFSNEEKKEKQFHQMFSQAWQALDSSITPIEHPGYLL
jgi:hypothetical protein